MTLLLKSWTKFGNKKNMIITAIGPITTTEGPAVHVKELDNLLPSNYWKTCLPYSWWGHMRRQRTIAHADQTWQNHRLQIGNCGPRVVPGLLVDACPRSDDAASHRETDRQQLRESLDHPAGQGEHKVQNTPHIPAGPSTRSGEKTQFIYSLSTGSQL